MSRNGKKVPNVLSSNEITVLEIDFIIPFGLNYWNTPISSSMLVTVTCWWQVWDVGDKFETLVTDLKYCHHFKVTNMALSPTSLIGYNNLRHMIQGYCYHFFVGYFCWTFFLDMMDDERDFKLRNLMKARRNDRFFSFIN